MNDGRAVASCTGDVDRARPLLRDMEEIAWILRSDPQRSKIGVVRSCRLPAAERDVLEEE